MPDENYKPDKNYLDAFHWGRMMRTPPPEFRRGRCPKCGARLARREGIKGVIHETLEPAEKVHRPEVEEEPVEVTLTEVEAEDKWAREHADEYSNVTENEVPKDATPLEDFQPAPKTASRGKGSAEVRCKYCNAVIRTPTARFCYGCGASLKPRERGEVLPRGKVEIRKKSPVVPAEHTGKCMVCNTTLSLTDDVVWCPHCANLAHRNHLIQWIHTKHCCPTCGETLDEQDYK
jgi:hypothetical protein